MVREQPLARSKAAGARHHQHVALGKLIERTAQLNAVGLRPLAVLLKTFAAPAARNCLTCTSRLWPSVDTRASPRIME
jgi:hypothetical protein